MGICILPFISWFFLFRWICLLALTWLTFCHRPTPCSHTTIRGPRSSEPYNPPNVISLYHHVCPHHHLRCQLAPRDPSVFQSERAENYSWEVHISRWWMDQHCWLRALPYVCLVGAVHTCLVEHYSTSLWRKTFFCRGVKSETRKTVNLRYMRLWNKNFNDNFLLQLSSRRDLERKRERKEKRGT